MRRSCGLLLLIGLVVAPLGAQAEELPEKLVAKLGSRRFAERESATAALMAQPSPAAVQLLLKAAATSPDAEVRRRARLVLEHLRRSQEAEQVLKPQTLRLNYKDLPVTEAIADFTRRTGLPLVLDKEAAARLAGRKLTLETPETTTWDAFRQLCDRAGLTERTPSSPPAPSGSYAYGNLGMQQRGMAARQVIFLDGSNSMIAPKQDERLILVVGKDARPTTLAGAVRIQLVGQPKATRTNLAREVTFTLNVATEPRLGWNRVIALRVETAVDSLGQRLAQPAVYVGEGNPSPFASNEVIVLWDGMSELPSTKSRQAPLRLLLGERPAQRITELRGVLSAEVEAPTAPLVTVDDVVQAAGKTIKGLDGSSAKVLEAKRERSGTIALKVEVKGPPKKSDISGLTGVRILRINRGIRGLDRPVSTLSAADAAARGLSLLDSKGAPLALVSGNYSLGDPNAAQTYTLMYQPRQGQEGPFRFVFSGRRTVIVDVPFTLKDIPLP
jgi:hypothetical protein